MIHNLVYNMEIQPLMQIYMDDITKRITEAVESTGLSNAEIGRRVGVTRATVSHWLSGLAKGLRAETAQELERVTGYSAEWISTGRGNKMANIYHDINSVDVPLLSTEGSMGAGSEVIDPEVLSAISVNKEWIVRNLFPTPQDKNLRFIHAYGDSMEPTFRSGDILLVDIGCISPDIDGVYVLEANKMLFIKRVSRSMYGKVTVTSDNPQIKTADILDGSEDVIIHGRVIYAWNGKTM